MAVHTPEDQELPLGISPEVVCFLVGKLREYGAVDLLAETGEPAAEEPCVLDREDIDTYTEHENDYRNEPVRQEFESFINDLPEDHQVELVALMWLGRSNGGTQDWPAVREEAAQAYNTRTALYLLGTPLASDFLQEGLSTLNRPGIRGGSNS